MQFEKAKLYMFSLENFKESYNGVIPISAHRWAREINHKLVDKIIDKNNAIIINNQGTKLTVEPKWCEEIIDAKFKEENII